MDEEESEALAFGPDGNIAKTARPKRRDDPIAFTPEGTIRNLSQIDLPAQHEGRAGGGGGPSSLAAPSAGSILLIVLGVVIMVASSFVPVNISDPLASLRLIAIISAVGWLMFLIGLLAALLEVRSWTAAHSR